MSELFNKALVCKQNVLNELRSSSMTLQELRFFTIYLSKINPRDKSTRVVKFPLSDFLKIMDIEHINMTRMKEMAQSLLTKVVFMPTERGGFTGLSLFNRFTFDKNDLNDWCVEICASEEIMPLLFDFKDRYFSYRLWNALRLKSPNQIRMYEILKQFEKLGNREIKVDELRNMLGIEKKEYPRWDNFKRKVLDNCQKALAENTDICYTYERGKTGRGGKWITIVFHISKNEKYADPLTLENFIEQKPDPAAFDGSVDDGPEQCSLFAGMGPDDPLALMADACDNKFSREQMEYLMTILVTVPDDILPNVDGGIEIRRHHYLLQKYAELNLRCDNKSLPPVRSPFAYLVSRVRDDAREPFDDAVPYELR